MSTTFHLFRLQTIDSQLDKVQRRLDEIQKELDDDRELKQAEAYFEACFAEFEKSEKTLRKAEGDVKQQRVKIEQTEAMLYGGSVKNPKEVQDLQHKSESLKRHLSTLEDVQLEAMLANDEQNEVLQKSQNDLNALKAEFVQKGSLLKGERSGLNEEKEILLSKRDTALSGIQADHLALYNQLREKRRGVAIAAINHAGCSACGATLPPAIQQQARSVTEFVYCPSCKRILYGN